MPIMSKHYRKTFKFFQVDGVPAAETVVLAGHAWILCCPLCGCLHEVRGGQTEGAYRPDCLLRRLAAMPAVRGVHAGADWARVLALWQSAYPAAAHDTVLLLSPAALEAAQVKRPAARPLVNGSERPKKGGPGGARQAHEFPVLLNSTKRA